MTNGWRVISLLGMVSANVLALEFGRRFGAAASNPVFLAQAASLAVVAALLPLPFEGALLLITFFGGECLGAWFGSAWPWADAAASPSVSAAAILPICLALRSIGLLQTLRAPDVRRIKSHQFSLASAAGWGTLACVCLAAVRLLRVNGIRGVELRTLIQYGVLVPLIAFGVLVACTSTSSSRRKILCAGAVLVAWSLNWCLDVHAFGLGLGILLAREFIIYALATTMLIAMNALALRVLGFRFAPNGRRA